MTCPIGWFKSGFITEECKPCGAGLLTDKPGATAEDDCFLPAGWGSKASDSGDLVASKCVFGTYGVAVPRYGLTPSACQVSSIGCCCGCSAQQLWGMWQACGC